MSILNLAASSMNAATYLMSASKYPRVVTAGVPIRTPPGVTAD